MNFSTFIIGLLVLVVFVAIVRHEWKNRKSGGCSGCASSGKCGGGCGCSTHHSKH